jgi:Uma2 family endonuclease
MGIPTAGYLEAIDHLPDGATLVLHQFGWEDYERLIEELQDRPRLRVSYDSGTLEIMSPLPEHEEYARFIEDLVRALGDELDLLVEKRGSATWKRRRLAKGVEADACFYVATAERIIGKRQIDLEVDPPPDVAVEIDVTNESLRKFATYAALGVPEIWRYDTAERRVSFYELAGNAYDEIPESRFFPGLTPAALGAALEQSKTEGQTAALRAFRQQWRKSGSR